ncbi:MAG: hypothetical protein WD960_09300 [Gemmatimonadota bacterium]
MKSEETDGSGKRRLPRLLLEAVLTVGLLGFTIALIGQEGPVPADTLLWLGLL